MAEHLIIVHGWSDSALGFAGVRDFLVDKNFYQPNNIRVINYKSWFFGSYDANKQVKTKFNQDNI